MPPSHSRIPPEAVQALYAVLHEPPATEDDRRYHRELVARQKAREEARGHPQLTLGADGAIL
jgi:hypothetical protein